MIPSMTMDIGPVEFLLVGFPGNKFSGKIVPALAQRGEDGTIRIIDLAFVKKDADGSVEMFEYDELDELAALADVEGEVDGLLGQADLEDAAASLEPDSSAALLVWENLWAKRFADALNAADGEVLGSGYIPKDVVEAALEIMAVPGPEGSE
jgi:hypothetical protein